MKRKFLFAAIICFLIAVLTAALGHASSQTTNLKLNKPGKGDRNWGQTVNDNMDKIDSEIATIRSKSDDLPEVYIYTGAFNSTTGTQITLPKAVDNVNEYAVKVTPTSRAGAIGDIYVTKTTSNFTVKCSEANTTDTFSASVYYIGNVSSYGSSIYRKWYVSPDTGITDHADSSQTGSLAWIQSQIGGIQATVELPGNKNYQLKQNLTVAENIKLKFQKGAIIDTDFSIRDSNYQWNLSGFGTNEYYLQASGGGNPNVNAPSVAIENNAQMTEGNAGSLAAGEWDWADNDSLGYATIYVRLSDSTDPDSKSADYVEAGYLLTINDLSNPGPTQIIVGEGNVLFGNRITEDYPEWFGTVDGTADDIQIQAAIDAFPAANSGTIKCLADSYVIDSKVILKERKILEGIGTTYNSGGTIFTSNVSGDACVQIGDGSTSSSGSEIRNIKVTAGTGTSGTGFFVYYGNRNHLINCYASGFTAGTGLKISGGATGNLPSIQNVAKDIYLSGNLVNLHLTGEDADTDSSSDEGWFSNIRINLAGLSNSTGIYIEKGFNNAFGRVTIQDSSGPGTGTVGVHFGDGTRSNVYSTRGNIFSSLDIENVVTGIKTDENCQSNTIFSLHIHNPTVISDDASGGSTIIRNIYGGLNLSAKAMYHTGLTYNNQLYNSEFEKWEYGTAVAPSSWLLYGTGATVARDGSNQRKGSYCAALTRNGADASLYQAVTGAGTYSASAVYLQGRWIAAGAWVKCSVASRARIKIADGVGYTASAYHSGSGDYEFLAVRRRIDSAATYVNFIFEVNTGNVTAQIDQAIIVEGFEVPLPNETPVYDSKRLYYETNWDPLSMAANEVQTTSVTVVGAAVGDPVIASHENIGAQDVMISAHVEAADTVRVILLNKSAGAINITFGKLRLFVLKPLFYY